MVLVESAWVLVETVRNYVRTLKGHIGTRRMHRGTYRILTGTGRILMFRAAKMYVFIYKKNVRFCTFFLQKVYDFDGKIKKHASKFIKQRS